MLSLLCAFAACAPQSDPQPPALLISAKTIVVAPDLVLTDGRLLLRGGKVAAVGASVPQEVGPDVHRVDLGDATVVPGLVVAHTCLDAERDLAETVTAYTPELRAVEAYDPYGKGVAEMLAGGVTAFGIAPRSANTLAGLAGAVKTDPRAGSVLRNESYLLAAIVPEALDQQRFPTSRMGALDLVRTAFRTAAGPLAAQTPDREVLRDVLSGALPFVVHARTHDEVARALDLADPARDGVLAGSGARLFLLGAGGAHRAVDRIAALAAGVVIEPLHPGLAPEALALPAALAARKVRLAFSAGSPRELRVSAALAVRHGLPRAAALAAMTAWPAAMLGIDDRCGTLHQGKDADLVVFDGDPVDLGARVIAVCLQGHPVAGDPGLLARD